jgi:hypothetical protein
MPILAIRYSTQITQCLHKGRSLYKLELQHYFITLHKLMLSCTELTHPYFSAVSLARCSLMILLSSKSHLLPHSTTSGSSQYACVYKNIHYYISINVKGFTNVEKGFSKIPQVKLSLPRVIFDSNDKREKIFM